MSKHTRISISGTIEGGGNCMKIEMAKISDDIEINKQNVFVKTEICAELSLTMWKISTKTTC